MHAQNAIDLLGCTSAKWRTDILRAEASATNASKHYVQVAALKAKLANPTEKIPADQALKARGSVYTVPHDASQQWYNHIDTDKVERLIGGSCVMAVPRISTV